MAFQWPSTSSKATAQTLLRTWLSRLSHTRRTMMSTTVDGLPSFLHSSRCTQLKKEEVAAFSTLKTPFLRCKRNFIFPFNLSLSFSLTHNSPQSFHLHLFSPTHSFLHTHNLLHSSMHHNLPFNTTIATSLSVLVVQSTICKYLPSSLSLKHAF